MMSFCVLAMWVAVFIPTVIGFFKGTLFPAPCLNALPPAYMAVSLFSYELFSSFYSWLHLDCLSQTLPGQKEHEEVSGEGNVGVPPLPL